MAAAVSARYASSPAGISASPLRILLFLLLAAFPCTLMAQQRDEDFVGKLDDMIAEAYGPDQHLVNGIEYVNLHIRSEGHKFLGEDEYYPGRVVIDHIVYNDVFLKYDILNQRVLLLIQHQSGGNKQLILNNLRINEFMIDGKTFHKYTFPGSGTRFYQVLGSDDLACLCHFSKQEISKPVDNSTLSEFTDEKRRTYLYRPAELIEFRSNRSFVRIFPGHESQIKAYLRQNKFRVRKLSDEQMTLLISYCHSISQIRARGQ